MDHLGFLGAGLCVLAALATVHWLAPRFRVELDSDRYASIDGARGFAAFFVFLCHAAGWYYFARTGKWAHFPIRGYANFGQVSVVVFFMITAYLFVSKLLNAGPKGMDWLRLLVSRVLRIYPLYLFAMLVVVTIVAIETGFAWTQPADLTVQALSHWLMLTAWDAPDLNGLKDTWLIIAGVTWSLPYEAFFYLMLPLLGTLARVPVSKWVVVLCTALAAALSLTALKPMLAVPFIGGIVAAVLVRNEAFVAFAQKPLASAIAIGSLVIATGLFWGAFKLVPLVLISVAFAFIACGNTLFGLLSSRPARLLGEVSYSMYLLHAVLLFCVLRWVIGVENVAAMTLVQYWALMLGLTPVLVALCLFTFSLIERPAMDSVNRLTASMRRAATRRVLPS
jgi:peptidoglycan/LPS O-acetylase OafA/YrhL